MTEFGEGESPTKRQRVEAEDEDGESTQGQGEEEVAAEAEAVPQEGSRGDGDGEEGSGGGDADEEKPQGAEEEGGAGEEEDEEGKEGGEEKDDNNHDEGEAAGGDGEGEGNKEEGEGEGEGERDGEKEEEEEEEEDEDDVWGGEPQMESFPCQHEGCGGILEIESRVCRWGHGFVAFCREKSRNTSSGERGADCGAERSPGGAAAAVGSDAQADAGKADKKHKYKWCNEEYAFIKADEWQHHLAWCVGGGIQGAPPCSGPGAAAEVDPDNWKAVVSAARQAKDKVVAEAGTSDAVDAEMETSKTAGGGGEKAGDGEGEPGGDVKKDEEDVNIKEEEEEEEVKGQVEKPGGEEEKKEEEGRDGGEGMKEGKEKEEDSKEGKEEDMALEKGDDDKGVERKQGQPEEAGSAARAGTVASDSDQAAKVPPVDDIDAQGAVSVWRGQESHEASVLDLEIRGLLVANARYILKGDSGLTNEWSKYLEEQRSQVLNPSIHFSMPFLDCTEACDRDSNVRQNLDTEPLLCAPQTLVSKMQSRINFTPQDAATDTTTALFVAVMRGDISGIATQLQQVSQP